jgi:glycosyltransferase involved in cell wall biosynthesis
LAVAGLNLINREHVRIAETDAEFATAIIELLAQPESRAAMAARARAWACANLGWDGAVASYESLYQELITSQSRRVPGRPAGFGGTAPDRGAR